MEKTNTKLLIANWKSHKTVTDAIEWMRIFTSFNLSSLSETVEIIICPSAPLLFPLKKSIEQFPNIKLGVQDISQYPAGAHTGEISAENLVGLTDYILINHSETKKIKQISDRDIKSKLEIAQNFGFIPILCCNEKPDSDITADILVYEPLSSINYGTPHPGSIDSIVNFKQKLNQSYTKFLYGGSVSPENATDYLSDDLVDGFLVGTNSLDPLSFYSIAQKF